MNLSAGRQSRDHPKSPLAANFRKQSATGRVQCRSEADYPTRFVPGWVEPEISLLRASWDYQTARLVRNPICFVRPRTWP